MLRLLPKNEAARRRTEEDRQRMDEGMRVAERVDTLREIASSDEVAIEQYRISSLVAVQEEVNAFTATLDEKRDALKEAERAWRKLMETNQAPLDKQWLLFVSIEKKRIENQQAQLAKELGEADKERTRLKEIEHLLTERDVLLRKGQNDTTISLQVAEKNRLESQRTLDNARTTSEKLIAAADKKDKASEELREDVQIRSRLLDMREKELEQREQDVLVKELMYYSPVKSNNK